MQAGRCAQREREGGHQTCIVLGVHPLLKLEAGADADEHETLGGTLHKRSHLCDKCMAWWDAESGGNAVATTIGTSWPAD